MPSMLGNSRRDACEVRGVHDLSNTDFGFFRNTWENKATGFLRDGHVAKYLASLLMPFTL